MPRKIPPIFQKKTAGLQAKDLRHPNHPKEPTLLNNPKRRKELSGEWKTPGNPNEGHTEKCRRWEKPGFGNEKHD